MKISLFFIRRGGRDARGRSVHRILGLHTMWRGEEKVVWRKCASCSGGVQALNPVTGKWGPVPPSLRREQADRTGFPQANIRNCHSCHGVGKHWVAEKENREKRGLDLKARLVLSAVALAVAAGLSYTAAPAHAATTAAPQSATGCNFIYPWVKAGACVSVRGFDTFVEEVRGGALLRIGTSKTGVFHIYDTDKRFSITTLNYECKSTIAHPGACWSVWRRVNDYLPVGDHVCVAFHSGHAIYGPACETIE